MAGFFPYRTETFGGVVKSFRGKAGAAVSVGDPLTLQTDGYYDLASSGGQIDGVAGEAATAAAEEILIYSPSLTYKVVTATTAPDQADVGTLIDFSGTTGAVVVTPEVSTNDDFFVEGIIYALDPAETGTPAIGDEVYGHFVDTNMNI